jgi:hypothetical protein
MTNGMSLVIGVSFVDPAKYVSPISPLPAAELDAQSIAEIARQQGFWTKLLLNAEADSDGVLTAIQGAAAILQAGDIFLLYFSGHGNKVLGAAGPTSEDAWLLYDRMLTKGEVSALVTTFRVGVRILVITDSCNNGGIVSPAAAASLASSFGNTSFVVKSAPPLKVQSAANNVPPANPAQASIAATVLLLASSGPDENSISTPKHGVFTQQLLTVWNNGGFTGNCVDFFLAIAQGVAAHQTPFFQPFGAPNTAFTSQNPFTI